MLLTYLFALLITWLVDVYLSLWCMSTNSNNPAFHFHFQCNLNWLTIKCGKCIIKLKLGWRNWVIKQCIIRNRISNSYPHTWNLWLGKRVLNSLSPEKSRVATPIYKAYSGKPSYINNIWWMVTLAYVPQHHIEPFLLWPSDRVHIIFNTKLVIFTNI